MPGKGTAASDGREQTADETPRIGREKNHLHDQASGAVHDEGKPRDRVYDLHTA